MKNILALIGVVVVGLIIWNVISESLPAPTATTQTPTQTLIARGTNVPAASPKSVSLQSQCEARALQQFNLVWAQKRANVDSTFGRGSTYYATHTAHYNKAMSACIANFGVIIGASSDGTTRVFYNLNNLTTTDPSAFTIGVLNYIAETGQVSQCVFNGISCSGYAEYFTLAEPYLRN